ncbi:MAG: twitch domain-containing radical SAM protein [Bdellovibrio sp.]
MSDSSKDSPFDVLAQRLYRGVFQAYSRFFTSMPVSLWYRNSLRLNYLTPLLSDIDVSFDCGELSDADVCKIQNRHNRIRRLFLRVGEANFYVRRHKDFIQKYANPLELARDPDLLGNYDIRIKDNPLLEAHKFVFAARSLNSDKHNLRKRPSLRLKKWNFHLRSLGFQEVTSLERESLSALLNERIFSAKSSLPYAEILQGLLNNKMDARAPVWLLEKQTSLAFFLLCPIQWLAIVAKQSDFKKCLPQLTALNPFEQQIAFCHITWEISALLTQFTWAQNPEQYNQHLKRLMQVCRLTSPYNYQELLQDLLKLGLNPSTDLFTGLDAATISPTYCKQVFTNIDIDTTGALRICERDEDLTSASDLNSFSLSQLRQSPERLSLQKSMLAGEKHPHCERCYQDEDLTNFSHRILSNRGIHLESPTQARLKLGKSCELMCFKCSAGASSSWEKFFSKTPNTDSINWYMKPEFWLDFEKILPQLTTINLSGGDALSFEGHHTFLQRIIDSGNAKHIELIYHTNGQRDIHPFFALWNLFKNVNIVIVLDGVGERNNYLRPPSSWSKIQENIQILDNSPDFIDGTISFAVHALNAFYLLNELRWLKSQSFKKINVPKTGIALLMPQYTNDFRSLQACPANLKSEIEKNLRTALEENLASQDEILSLIGFMKSQDTFDGSAIKRIQILDKIHQTDFYKSLPEIAGYF